LRAESLEPFRVLLYVVLDGNEVLVDEVTDPRIGIYLGIQPGASRSHWSGTEIEEKGFVLFARLMECGIHILVPSNWHISSCLECRAFQT
jgi:hypothetical protein